MFPSSDVCQSCGFLSCRGCNHGGPPVNSRECYGTQYLKPPSPDICGYCARLSCTGHKPEPQSVPLLPIFLRHTFTPWG